MRSIRPSQKGLLLISAILLLLSGVVFAWFVGSLLVAPHPTTVSLPPTFAGTEATFPSTSGAQLRGNLLRGQSGKGVVILMHGVRGNRGAMADHAAFLHRAGFSVLLFDFQAHGESSGSKITSGHLESMDATAAVKFARATFPAEKIAALGSSLGGAAVILAQPPIELDAAILELVYPDIDTAVKNRIAIVLGDWARPFSFMLVWQFKPRLGINPASLSPAEKIAHLACPKFILAGAKDRHTTIADTQLLFARAQPPKELWIIENAAHQNLHTVAGTEYEKRIVAFLEHHLSAPKQPAMN
jgi:fermentation-respiration switch protein FrsA (DUF1100 family)